MLSSFTLKSQVTSKSIFGKNCFIYHKEKVKRSQLRAKNHNIIDFILENTMIIKAKI